MSRIFRFISLLAVSISAKAQIVTTVAGGGMSSTEDIPATSVIINNPGQLAFDRAGNLYFPQILSHRVSQLKTNGNLMTAAGTGMAGDTGDGGDATLATFSSPNTVIFDSVGNMFVCDNNNNKIRRIDKLTGIISTVVGTGSPGYSGDGGPSTSAMLYYPAGICFDRKGDLLISDGTRRLRKVNNLGIISTIAGIGLAGVSGDGGPATAARCGAGVICIDNTGNIYIADCATGESRIAKIDTFGIITTFAGTSTTYVFNGDDIPATNANIDPVGIAIDKNGNVIFADRLNNRIRQVDQNGIIQTIAGIGTPGFGGDGGPAMEAAFNWPQGIAIDTCGNVYVSDNNNARIRKIAFNPDCLPISVKDVKSNEAISVTLHPNPATETLTITAGVEIETITIVNAIGQVVTSPRPSPREREVLLNISHLPPGVYMVRVNETWVGKFVKE